jgi:deoxyribodipyrimidine photo-lyase
MIQEARIKALNSRAVRKGRNVLYWMQASQRAEYNHALEYALLRANELRLPVLVFFGITDAFPQANERHYAFMLEGLRETQGALLARGIAMAIIHRPPHLGAVDLSRDAALAVVDRGYLSVQRKWRRYAARRMECPLIEVESDVVVPVETASSKEEYAAATIRAKINTRVDEFLTPLRARRATEPPAPVEREVLDVSETRTALAGLKIDRSVGPVGTLHGGTRAAKRLLKTFIARRLDRFSEMRNDPTEAGLSDMSPYLHFGQISPVYIARKVKGAASPGTAAYLEELIVRRELAMNFVYYNTAYASFRALPQWAQRTLARHSRDRRPYVYTRAELEGALTHDPYWNAAQDEMLVTGKMHGYMRMYWGKKIVEWTRTPEEAFKTVLYLNNKYELDGRDPNGFAGVAWCFGKHDRPWGERAIFGQVRYMNDKGLRRKFDADGYVEKVKRLKIRARGEGHSS